MVVVKKIRTGDCFAYIRPFVDPRNLALKLEADHHIDVSVRKWAFRINGADGSNCSTAGQRAVIICSPKSLLLPL
jgi:hypothetical protein